MKERSDPPPAMPPKRVVVRPVTLEPEGERLVPLAVCPRKLSVLPVAQCGACADFAGLCINPQEGAPFMRCAFDDAPFVHAPDGEPAPHPSAPFQGVRVRDVMTQPAEHATLDMSVELLLRELLPSVEALPVIDDAGQAIGVVTCSDLLRRLHEREASDRDEPELSFTLRDITLSPGFMVTAEAPIGHVAAMMAYERVQHVLVVDQDRRLQGMVAALDIARWLACRAGYVVPG